MVAAKAHKKLAHSKWQSYGELENVMAKHDGSKMCKMSALVASQTDRRCKKKPSHFYQEGMHRGIKRRWCVSQLQPHSTGCAQKENASVRRPCVMLHFCCPSIQEQ
uniref:Uncharacterized protein n=1 Tax=Arundo donax TaxID=35708 RepID=A0A0A8YBY1_ARUDO